MKKEIKIQAIKLRKLGYSLLEISKKCGVSKSTASVWLRNVKLNKRAKNILWVKGKDNWKKGNEAKYAKKQKWLAMTNSTVGNYLNSLENIGRYYKLLCAFLYWCEGSKTGSLVTFTNSDPMLLSTFLSIFRKAFSLDEAKFRVILHIHNYHNDLTQKGFWSKITLIPIQQFLKSYKKPNGGNNIRIGYQGCVSIRYYDTKIFEELKIIYSQFAKKI